MTGQDSYLALPVKVLVSTDYSIAFKATPLAFGSWTMSFNSASR
jgi:hypothetical protein